MLSERKSRRLVEFVLQKFESDYKGQWEQERFTVFPHPCKTKLYRTADWQGLREIEERTARFAGPTLDLYVRPSKSKKGSNGDNK